MEMETRHDQNFSNCAQVLAFGMHSNNQAIQTKVYLIQDSVVNTAPQTYNFNLRRSGKILILILNPSSSSSSSTTRAFCVFIQEQRARGRAFIPSDSTPHFDVIRRVRAMVALKILVIEFVNLNKDFTYILFYVKELLFYIIVKLL